jgi:type I restriction enzyme S subunit
MSSEWPMVRLGDHVEACLGKMLDAKKNKGTPQPYLGNSNVRWGQFDLKDLAEMRFEPHEEERYSLLPGDLVVCEGGEPGRCAIWTGPAGMKVQKALHRIRPKGSLDNYYLFYWFKLAAKAGLLEPFFTGTTIKHLTGRAVAALEVPLPPIEVQRFMVDVLMQLDDRIALLRQTNVTLEAIAQALFKSWFVDFDPVHAKMAGCAPEGMDEATATLFPDALEETELGVVPKGWKVGSVGDFAQLKKGTVNPGVQPQTLYEHYSLPAFDNGQRPVIELGAAIKSNKTPVPADAVLLSKLNPHIPRVWLPVHCGPNAVCSTEFLAFLPVGVGSRELIYCAFSSPDFIARLQQLVTGTSNSHQRIKPDQVELMTSVVPPDTVARAFESFARPVFERVHAIREQGQTLAALRDALLPRLISGQLRLPEAQAQLEDALA